jgi:enamine deaminase RidA (YjgF/YER057c/UK114 family)
MALERRQPEGYKARNNIYTQVIKSTGTNMIHVAGTVPMDGNGNPLKGGMKEQTQLVWKNIGISLAEFGAKPSDVVRINQYTTDIDTYLKEGLGEMEKFFAEHKPTSTLVEVKRLVFPEWLIEIEATAILD